MKKIIFVSLVLSICFTLPALDLVLKNGKVYKNYSGLGGVAPVNKKNLNDWGVVVYYDNGSKQTVVRTRDVPADFVHYRHFQKRQEKIPAAMAKAKAEADAEKKELKEEQAKNQRIKAAVKGKKGVPDIKRVTISSAKKATRRTLKKD